MYGLLFAWLIQAIRAAAAARAMRGQYQSQLWQASSNNRCTARAVTRPTNPPTAAATGRMNLPLPPKGDPQRPLSLAIRSTRLLGIVLILFGFVALLPFAATPRGISLLLTIVIALFYLGPGVLYLLCAIFLKRRRLWAVVVALVLASIQLLLAILGIVTFAIQMFSALHMNSMGAFAIIPLIVILFFIAAFVQLIYHLSCCFEAIKFSPPEFQRGFEPLVVQPQITDLPREQ